jgi:hypothetical protein
MSGHVFGHEILSLAQQGHPIAIATLLNYVTQPHGIKLRVHRQDDRLQMLLESQQIPPVPDAIDFVQRSMKILNVGQVTTVHIYGRQRGKWVPAWQKTIYLETESYWQSIPFFFSTPGDRSDLASVEEEPVEPVPLSSSDNPVPAMESSEAPLALNETETSAIVLHEDDPSPENETLHEDDAPDLLKRPESVIFLFFISLLLFWDAYLSLLEEMERNPMQAHSTSQLSRRLKTAKGTIRRRKYSPDFSEWTQHLDPDGIAWVYQRGLYVPQLEQG